MAFNRIIELNIGKAGIGTLVSDLDIEFEIEKTVTETINTAEFTIHNLSSLSSTNILQEGNTIILKAGHQDEGNAGIIWTGTVDAVNRVKQESNWITTISSTDTGNNKTGWRRYQVSLSYAPDSPVQGVLNELLAFLGGTPINGQENIAGVTFPNGFAFVGTLSQAFQKLAQELRKQDIFFYFSNAELYFFKLNAPSVLSTVFLSSQTGLIGSPEKIIDPERENTGTWISFKSILNPKIGLNSIVTLSSTEVNGSFFVKKAVYRGNNFGGPFEVEAEAVQ